MYTRTNIPIFYRACLNAEQLVKKYLGRKEFVCVCIFLTYIFHFPYFSVILLLDHQLGRGKKKIKLLVGVNKEEREIDRQALASCWFSI